VADDIISKTHTYIEARFKDGDPAHDYWHIHRVWQLAKHIAEQQGGADLLTVELAALMHDIADYKTGVTNEAKALEAGRQWLLENGLDAERADAVIAAVRAIGFRGGKGEPQTTLEAQIVSDADLLDAIGAIGIARAFGYAGAKGKTMYDPGEEPQTYDSVEAYKVNTASTITHFYEKLLLLKDRLHTQAAKHIAEHRHRYMEQFLEEFHEEWAGKR